ncbi:MAG: hypothetical protein JF592_07950 [Microbacterium sp.]|uniref:Uncharacterized protein n=1 Tax=Microbacterium natoriense TaxID=284570 RepID=A0AAW8F3Z5_9MICO|nr:MULTISPECIES: hypothetical protein [Microbacterium]MBW8762505.1 hypothetical protein [Microbacterium sp.]MDQ0649700.1 hypothetical protein [Microbacterium natoriense]
MTKDPILALADGTLKEFPVARTAAGGGGHLFQVTKSRADAVVDGVYGEQP